MASPLRWLSAASFHVPSRALLCTSTIRSISTTTTRTGAITATARRFSVDASSSSTVGVVENGGSVASEDCPWNAILEKTATIVKNVADRKSARVLHFSPDGRFIKHLGQLTSMEIVGILPDLHMSEDSTKMEEEDQQEEQREEESKAGREKKDAGVSSIYGYSSIDRLVRSRNTEPAGAGAELFYTLPYHPRSFDFVVYCEDLPPSPYLSSKTTTTTASTAAATFTDSLEALSHSQEAVRVLSEGGVVMLGAIDTRWAALSNSFATGTANGVEEEEEEEDGVISVVSESGSDSGSGTGIGGNETGVFSLMDAMETGKRLLQGCEVVSVMGIPMSTTATTTTTVAATNGGGGSTYGIVVARRL